jgi:ABC-type nitrate/sulfonate/bicarbonate transport system substrate-binding protein
VAAASPSAAVAASPAAAAPVTGARETMQVGYAGDPAGVLPVLVAAEQGIYARHGLDVSFYSIVAGQQPMAALLGGDVNVMFLTAETVSARLGGADVQYVVAPSGAPLFHLYARPDVASIEQLSGKTIGITGVGTATEAASNFLLQQHGLKPGQDANLLALGNVGSVLPALQANGVQAGILPVTLALQGDRLGMHSLADAAREGWHFVGSWGTVTGPYLRSHKAALSQFVQAEIEAAALVARDKTVAKQVLGKYLQTQDDGLLEYVYQAYNGQYRKAPYPTEPDVQATLEFVAGTQPAARTANPADFIDREVVQELEANGFIDNAWK